MDGLSPASRKRLLETCARIAWSNPSTFITLTYGPEFPTPVHAKQNMRSFLERIRRRHNESSGVWVLELQKRGAPHFHFVMSNLPFIPKEEIQAWWGEIISFEKPFTRIEAVKKKRVTRYIAKYVAKKTVPKGEGACGYEAYDKPTREGRPSPTGRMWGLFNKPAIPWADSKSLAKLHGEWYHSFKQNAKAEWDGVDDETPDGFTLFLDDAIAWLDSQSFSE